MASARGLRCLARLGLSVGMQYCKHHDNFWCYTRPSITLGLQYNLSTYLWNACAINRVWCRGQKDCSIMQPALMLHTLSVDCIHDRIVLNQIATTGQYCRWDLTFQSNAHYLLRWAVLHVKNGLIGHIVRA